MSIVLGLCIYLNFRPDCYRCSCQFRVVFAEKWWNFHGRFSRDLCSQMLGKRISGGHEIKIFWGRDSPLRARLRRAGVPPINFFLAETLYISTYQYITFRKFILFRFSFYFYLRNLFYRLTYLLYPTLSSIPSKKQKSNPTSLIVIIEKPLCGKI